MVTFVCDSCDSTLKKKQLKTHHFNCPAVSVTCVDCYKHFVGNEHEGHTTCISEKDKYWGPYAQGKKKVKTENPQNGNQNGHAANGKEEAEEKEEEETPITFNGWKKTIKALLNKEQGSQMNKKELKKELKDLLIKEDYEVDEEHFEESVEKVLGFRAFEVSKKNVVRYVPPSERPPKKAPKTK